MSDLNKVKDKVRDKVPVERLFHALPPGFNPLTNRTLKKAPKVCFGTFDKKNV